MKYRVSTEKRYRERYARREESTRVYKYLHHNRLLGKSTRLKYSKKYFELLGVSRIKNYCVVTGRSRGVLSEFGLSRIAVKELFSAGKVYGVIKSSW